MASNFTALNPEGYEKIMGRFSRRLADPFLAFTGSSPGEKILDVGCGTGSMTAALARRGDHAAIVGIDVSQPYLDFARAHNKDPRVTFEIADASSLPFARGHFDRAICQLVLQFLPDPALAVTEMCRVVRPGGMVAACVWDFATGGGPLAAFWSAVRDLDPDAEDESGRAGTSEGHLVELFGAAGLDAVVPGKLTVTVPYGSFEDWWHPYTLGVGPAGDYVAALDPPAREALKAHCRERLPDGPFEIHASAWAARARTA
jgi:SAM-dependent methyltransferase